MADRSNRQQCHTEFATAAQRDSRILPGCGSAAQLRRANRVDRAILPALRHCWRLWGACSDGGLIQSPAVPHRVRNRAGVQGSCRAAEVLRNSAEQTASIGRFFLHFDTAGDCGERAPMADRSNRQQCHTDSLSSFRRISFVRRCGTGGADIMAWSCSGWHQSRKGDGALLRSAGAARYIWPVSSRASADRSASRADRVPPPPETKVARPCSGRRIHPAELVTPYRDRTVHE